MIINNGNLTYERDNYTNHYTVYNTKILFPNFSGIEKQFNNAGKRNFHIAVPEELKNEMEEMGVFTHELPPRNDGDDPTYTLKISVYEDANIELLNGKARVDVAINNANKDIDGGPIIDAEFRKGHVVNGSVNIEFHISRNTKVPGSKPYLRVDILKIPIRKSKLEEMYENYGMDDEDEDDLPM